MFLNLKCLESLVGIILVVFFVLMVVVCLFVLMSEFWRGKDVFEKEKPVPALDDEIQMTLDTTKVAVNAVESDAPPVYSPDTEIVLEQVSTSSENIIK